MEKKLEKLSETARDLFHLFKGFGKLHNIRYNVHAYNFEV